MFSGNVTLTDRFLTGKAHGSPSRDLINNLELLGWDTGDSAYTTVKFSRPLNTNDLNDTILVSGQSFKFSYCIKAGSLKMGYHGPTGWKVFTGVLSAGSKSSS